jgi:hypothetical protein
MLKSGSPIFVAVSGLALPTRHFVAGLGKLHRVNPKVENLFSARAQTSWKQFASSCGTTLAPYF